MPDEPISDDLLDEHRRIRELLTNSWSAFFARFGALRPVQRAAIPTIVSGRDVLVTAPTAGGKTEAVVAPLCERLVREQWKGLSILLVTPTRALVNDLFERLERPVDQMGISLGRKTADYAVSAGHTEQFIITTPESLESLLTFGRERLKNLRVIAVDEIHLLDGSPRGDQLRALLGRVRVYLRSIRDGQPLGLQVVALSATVPDPERTADAYLNSDRKVISVAGQRNLEARTVVAVGDDAQRAQAAAIAVGQFEDVHKVLVFVNSRKQVDAISQYFASAGLSDWPVHGHHGNLSKQKREHTEERFKAERRAICVATMTLEIGIDIGDVDLVICMDPPFSLSSFLQRIGRGCRRLQGKTRVLCVARDRAGELIFQGLIRQTGLGIPAGPTAPFRRSVLVQQILAYLRQVNGNRRTLNQFAQVFSHQSAPIVTTDMVVATVTDMVGTGLLDEKHTICQPGSDGWDFIESSRIYANIAPEPSGVTLVDAESGEPLAKVTGLRDHDGGVRIAGKSYEVMADSGSTLRVREGGQYEAAPRYFARSLPYASDVGIATGAALGFASSQLAVIESGSELIVMTWQGRLVNSCLAAAMTSAGVKARAASFAVIIQGVPAFRLRTILSEAAAALATQNPLTRVTVESIVDIGPYFRLLSTDAQAIARCDWLDIQHINKWIDDVEDVVTVDPNSDLGADVVALARL
jgi:ATP-dependent Lhr-like helicase